MKIIIRKYIQSTTEIYGYFAGATFANQIGLTTQMPAMLEIITLCLAGGDRGCLHHCGSGAFERSRRADPGGKGEEGAGRIKKDDPAAGFGPAKRSGEGD